ncbi:hypothetical protein H4R99_008666, partial [Coemansia sp. RSA 1722]
MAGKKKCAKPKSREDSTIPEKEAGVVAVPAIPGSPLLPGNFEGPPTKNGDSSYLTGSDPDISGDGTE